MNNSSWPKFQLYFPALALAVILLSVAGCKKDSPAPDNRPYRINDSILVDGRQRTFIVNLPPGYNNKSSFSLVLALHGGGGSAKQFDSTSKLSEKANASGFIVVFPDGTGAIRTWNAGRCCGFAMNYNVDDVKFISKLIDKLLSQYKIDPKKVYVTGHSNGGMLCYRLACEIPDKIAAIAPNSTTMVVSSPCNPSRPMPILHMHSILDEHVPYQGGFGNGVTGISTPPLDSVFAVWSSVNSCGDPGHVITSNSGYTLKEWLQCTNNAGIHYYLTNDGGHGWPGGLPGGPDSDTPSTAINANDLLWEFFQQYQLP